LAERFAQQALWLEALQQLQIARRADDADFYLLSKIDARINQVKAVMRENKIPIPASLKF
jgi:predicted Zn-dependent protease